MKSYQVPLGLASVCLALMVSGCLSSAPPAAGDTQAVGEPQEPVSLRLEHDYTTGKTVAHKFVVPPASGPYNVLLKIGGEGPSVCSASTGARLVVRSPDQSTYAELAPTMDNAIITVGDNTSGCVKKEEPRAYLASGEWIAEFSGDGVAVGIVVIEPAK